MVLVMSLGITSILPAGPKWPQPVADNPALWPTNYQSSGEYYNWRKTGQPEWPWFHKYDQSLVMSKRHNS